MDVHDEIRRIATERFVNRARDSGQKRFSIPIKALIELAEVEGMSTKQRTPAFCTAIQTGKFLKAHGLRVESVDGPASKKSTTVVVHYVLDDVQEGQSQGRATPSSGDDATRDPLLALRGVLRGAIREGAAAFLRELRRDADQRVDPGKVSDRGDGRESAA
ncbi:MAG TPA: hypothetical protein VGN01_02620 [Acidobacteriaceae bacterium]|jgi:hypothetical protein